MKTVKELVGQTVYDQVAAKLQKAFPDPRVVIAPEHIDGFILNTWNNFDDENCQKILTLPRPAQAEIDALNAALPKAGPQDNFVYYVAVAKHSRVSNPHHSFTAHLPLVKVTVAKTDAEATTITTAIGDVKPEDHLLQSIEQLAFKYDEDLGYVPARVDLITPARLGDSRFGAIAVYLGFKNEDDEKPSFYILEAGTATGLALMLFISPDMGPISHKKKWYQPTPFTSPDHTYEGNLVVDGKEPKELHVRSYDPSKNLDVYVDVQYNVSPPDTVWPAFLIAEAASRVGAISVKKGQLIFESLFAPIGFVLPWDENPN